MNKIILLITVFVFMTFNNNGQTVTDYDGNSYNQHTIGTQVWLTENLKVIHYCNGDAIPEIVNNFAWYNATNGARCYYNNDSVTNCNNYGSLYNWYAVNDSRKLCPTGWHVPTDNEWTILINYAGGSPYADTMLCQGCPLGFNALLAGSRSAFDGAFANINNFAYFWTSTEQSAANAWCYGGFNHNIPQMNNRDYSQKTAGMNIRCIKDSSTNINDIDFNNFKIYPNPTDGCINVSCYRSNNLKMQIYNILGKCVMQCDLKSNNTIDISSLTKGIYLIKITGIDWSVQEKLIKK